jgi:hypothetical protein
MDVVNAEQNAGMLFGLQGEVSTDQGSQWENVPSASR